MLQTAVNEPSAVLAIPATRMTPASLPLLPSGEVAYPVLSDKQMDTLRSIYRYASIRKAYPLPNDVAVAVGVTKQAIQARLNGLERKGFITRDYTSFPRTVLLTDLSLAMLRREEEMNQPQQEKLPLT